MIPTAPASGSVLADGFFHELTTPERLPIEGEGIAVVVAHPDDEAIGCGALLGRMKGATVVMVTDGAPRNLVDARAYGFASAAEYAAKRMAELRSSLAIAGLSEDALIPLAIPDQEAALNLAGLTGKIAQICEARGMSVLITHAYEGGHPDHDATAFAVHAAARLLAADQPIVVVEMPYYRMNTVATIYQQFRADGMSLQIAIPLDAQEKARKARMMAAHTTQKGVLDAFPLDVERFRPAPAYDFTELPNGGRLLYERHDWGMSGERWRELAKAAYAELGLDAKA